MADRLDQRYEPVVIEDADDIGSNTSSNTPLLEIVAARLGRRSVLKGFLSAAVAGGTLTSRYAIAAGSDSGFTFQSPPHTIKEDMQLAPGYRADLLMRWGDPVLEGAPAFDAMAQTADAQARQFGYNCDYLAYFPLPGSSSSAEHGLLHVNHEYTSPELMFAGWTKLEAGTPAREKAVAEAREKAIAEGKEAAAAEKEAKAAGEKAYLTAITKASTDAQTPAQTAIEMMAHGGSVIEVKKENGRWQVVSASRYARRLTAATEMRLAGPAAGHDRLRTGYDPTGTRVLGTLNNCAGGKTPWGTVLTAEENFHNYFGGGEPAQLPEARQLQALRHHGRGPLPVGTARSTASTSTKEPNEPNRFGWVVEYRPL